MNSNRGNQDLRFNPENDFLKDTILGRAYIVMGTKQLLLNFFVCGLKFMYRQVDCKNYSKTKIAARLVIFYGSIPYNVDQFHRSIWEILQCHSFFQYSFFLQVKNKLYNKYFNESKDGLLVIEIMGKKYHIVTMCERQRGTRHLTKKLTFQGTHFY